MSTTIVAKMRVIEVDLSGYYYPRWDRAMPITARGSSRQDAINNAADALGECPRGRGWGWRFRVDSIEVVPEANGGDPA